MSAFGLFGREQGFVSLPRQAQVGYLFARDLHRYDEGLDSYLLACGDDSLAEIQLASVRESGGSLSVDGSLVYLVDGSPLAQFHAQFARQDNMFGYVITKLTLG